MNNNFMHYMRVKYDYRDKTYTGEDSVWRNVSAISGIKVHATDVNIEMGEDQAPLEHCTIYEIDFVQGYQTSLVYISPDMCNRFLS